MPQIMIELGADTISPLAEALERLWCSASMSIEVLPRLDADRIEYTEANDSPHEAFRSLDTGDLASIRIRPMDPPIRWAIVFAPGFDRHAPTKWTAAVELNSWSYEAMFDELVSRQGLRFVAVTLEETLDLEPHHLTEEGFPWQAPNLMRAAIRGEEASSGFLIRSGPAALG